MQDHNQVSQAYEATKQEFKNLEEIKKVTFASL